jgi:acetyl/propionyl-CoA carboxylase alpha subunit
LALAALGRAYHLEVGREGGEVKIRLDGQPLALTVESGDHGEAHREGRVVVRTSGERLRARVVALPGGGYQVGLAGWTVELALAGPAARSGLAAAHEGRLGPVASPITGRLVKLCVEEGAIVAAGQPLAVVEAMKMENEIKAPAAGRVASIGVRQGEPVEFGQAILELVPEK